MRHTVIFASAFATLVTASAFAADLPGKGITVQPSFTARASSSPALRRAI